MLVSLAATAINTNGYIQGLRAAGSRSALGVVRIAGGSACYAAQVSGSLLLLLGSGTGIYVAAVGLVVNFGFLVSGSWLLIVGTVPGTDCGARAPRGRDCRS